MENETNSEWAIQNIAATVHKKSVRANGAFVLMVQLGLSSLRNGSS